MRFLKFCHLVYIAAPQFFLVSMWAMAFRASTFLGHWPIYMFDDPKNIGKDDVIFQKLFDTVEYTGVFAGFIFLFTLPFIASVFEGGFSKSYRRLILLAAFASWLLPIFDPLGTLGWIID